MYESAHNTAPATEVAGAMFTSPCGMAAPSRASGKSLSLLLARPQKPQWPLVKGAPRQLLREPRLTQRIRRAGQCEQIRGAFPDVAGQHDSFGAVPREELCCFGGLQETRLQRQPREVSAGAHQLERVAGDVIDEDTRRVHSRFPQQ